MTNNVIDINKKNNLKFKKTILKREIVNPETGENTVEQVVVIKLVNLENGRSRIHPFTSFITQYKNRKTKYVYNIAGYLVPFLNYIYFELSNTQLKNIEDLTFDIGISFLDNLNCSRSTKEQYEQVLSKFYYYLAERDILKNIHKSDFTFVVVNDKTVLKSPFENKYKKPKKESTNIIHVIEKEYLFTFLETAIKVEPQIAFGVYIQMFGGLRVSEVISLEYFDISFSGAKGVKSMTLSLYDKDLRPDIKTGFLNKVKKKRKQKIIPVGENLLYTLYQNHKKTYKQESHNAIFIDKNNKPMTAKVYTTKFNNIKKVFIKELLNSDDINNKSYGLYLKSQKWSTHMGRGIFSNLVTDVSDNANEIATWRGDSNLDSSLKYITDSKKIEEKLIAVMNQFYTGLGDLK